MGKSSKDKRDAYYRLAKEQGWRARSAFKLLQLDEEFDLFANVSRVVDLCAAPGSWSQVLSRVLIQGERLGRQAWEDRQMHERRKMLNLLSNKEVASAYSQSADHGDNEPESAKVQTRRPAGQNVKIVAIDLQPMSPLEGVTMLKADITHPDTVPLLLNALDPPPPLSSADSSSSTANTATNASAARSKHPVDLILSDGAPDVTGLHDLDIYIQSQLLWAALNLALAVLRPGGTFVAKIFRAKDVDLLFSQMRSCFADVCVSKPRSSRASSLEAFIVCRGFQRTAMIFDRVPLLPSSPSTRKILLQDSIEPLVPFPDDDQADHQDSDQALRWIAPFLACGDLSSWDSDASYKLPDNYVSLDPVQPPTAPPYWRALEERKRAGGAFGKTKSPAQESDQSYY